MAKRRRNVPSEVAKARSRLAVLTARGADPEQIELARLALDAANARIARARNLAEQITAVILAGGDDAAA